MTLWLPYFLDVLLVCLLCYLVWFEYKANHIAWFFWATVLGIYGLPSFVDARLAFSPMAVGRQVRLAGGPVLIEAPMFAILFAGIYLITRQYTVKVDGAPQIDVRTDLAESYSTDRVAKRFVVLLTIAAVLGSISGLYAIYTTMGTEGVLESGYQEFRLYADPAYMRPAIYLLAASSGGVFLAWRVRNRTALFFIVAATVGYFLLSFARQMLMFMVAPFALYLLYSKRSISARVALVVGSVLGYYFIIFLLFLRYQGANTDALEALFSGDLFQDFTVRAQHEGGELQLRYAYYYFLENPAATASVMPGQTYLRLLMLPLPSEYAFGLKPGLVDTTLWYAFYPEYWFVEGGSLHALIFGDCFANLGWAGVFLGGVWALIAQGTTKVIAKVPRIVRTAMYAPMGFGAVLVARGSVYNACAYVFWDTVIIGATYMLAKATVRQGTRRSAVQVRPIMARRSPEPSKS